MVGLAITFDKAEFSFYKDTLCILPEKKVHLTIKDGETREVHCARTLLEARKSTLKLQLEYLGNNLIIILIAEPIECVSQLSIAAKTCGILICFDHRPLNKEFKCEHYKLPLLGDVQP